MNRYRVLMWNGDFHEYKDIQATHFEHTQFRTIRFYRGEENPELCFEISERHCISIEVMEDCRDKEESEK